MIIHPTLRRRRIAPASMSAEGEGPFDSPALQDAADVNFRSTRPGIALVRPIPLERTSSSGRPRVRGRDDSGAMTSRWAHDSASGPRYRHYLIGRDAAGRKLRYAHCIGRRWERMLRGDEEARLVGWERSGYDNQLGAGAAL